MKVSLIECEKALKDFQEAQPGTLKFRVAAQTVKMIETWLRNGMRVPTDGRFPLLTQRQKDLCVAYDGRYTIVRKAYRR